ncbi:MAG: hypothetical protein JWO06_2755 [Bacteroidota bacterium]|nr:hypothetical protein [Bacteroidota bacterium]
MLSFNARIYIIGVNPYVLLPAAVLKAIFKQAGKERGAIPVRGKLDGYPFIQTLVKYSGKWRLYLNTPMRKAAKKDVGDMIAVSIEFDPIERTIPIHPEFSKALKKNKRAREIFETLSPSLKKEIVRYIANLKSEETVVKNVARAIEFLLGKGRFIGRDKP